jgi:hypothetical protein
VTSGDVKVTTFVVTSSVAETVSSMVAERKRTMIGSWKLIREEVVPLSLMVN